MKTITNTLTVGKEHAGLDLYCTLKMDGKKARRFRSRSFLGSFAYMLQGLMHGGADWKLGLTGYYSTWSDGRSNRMQHSAHDITASDEGTPMKITGNNTNLFRDFVDKDDPYPNYVTIFGAPEHNGTYRGIYKGSSVVELYHLDGTPVDGSKGSAVGGKVNPAIGFHQYPVVAHGSNEYWPHYSFQNWDILVGKSPKPVSVDDVYVWDRIMPGDQNGQLSHGAKSTSPIVTDKPTSRFTISKAFTNLADEDVIVRELGITTGMATGNSEDIESMGLGYAMVRDTLDSPLTIPKGRTLTIDYELVIRLTPDTLDTTVDGTNGGFLESFMRVVHSCTFRGFGNRVLLAVGGGVGLVNVTANKNYRPWQFGIRLGDDNQFASMTDTSLNVQDTFRNGYEHGKGDGTLYHYGNDVSLVSYDYAGNKASFAVTRIFENKGNTPIEVREIGLFANTVANSSQTNTSHFDNPPTLIARTALHPDDQFTIQPGEFKKVEYIIEVIA